MKSSEKKGFVIIKNTCSDQQDFNVSKTFLQACERVDNAVSNVTAENIQSFCSTEKNNKDLVPHVTKVMTDKLIFYSRMGEALIKYLLCWT